MSAAASSLGGTIGEGVGTWGGRIVGGAIGELFGPEAVPLGAYIGGKVGGYVGAAAGEYVASHMSDANEKAEGATDQKTPCASCSKRKCSEERHQELKNQMKNMQKSVFTNQAFKSGNVRKLALVPCEQVRQRLADMRALRDKRQQIQDECYPNDPEPGHEDEMKQLDNSIRNLQALELQNCGGAGT